MAQTQSNLDLSRQSYQAGRASLIVLLDAQRILLATRRGAVVADRESAITRAELERLTARPIIALLESHCVISQPATESTLDLLEPPAPGQPGVQP